MFYSVKFHSAKFYLSAIFTKE